ncbi:MAG: hypothetical protein HY332_20500 [Chloroflexi bacterium]|nr:hypothetical protein [Chloroflexota bacterium]
MRQTRGAPVPIALLVDDPCPLVHVFKEHWVHVHRRAPATRDGRPLLDTVPNSFLDRFCDVVDARGIAGKFSIVPVPAGKGDVVRGIDGYDPALTQQWLETARRRLSRRFDFCPEGLTHDLAVDLPTGTLLPVGENEWSQTQDRTTLTPYLTRALELLRRAGFDCTGITSPWVFGIAVEPEYQAAIIAAQRTVYRRDVSWYFLHMRHNAPGTRPWVAVAEGPVRLVAIASTVKDVWWETIDSPRTDATWIRAVADQLLTADGRDGAIRRVLDAGGWPVLLTHWQSLFSNGLETGLRVLDEVGRRVEHTLGDEVTWSTCTEVMQRTLVEAGTPA